MKAKEERVQSKKSVFLSLIEINPFEMCVVLQKIFTCEHDVGYLCGKKSYGAKTHRNEYKGFFLPHKAPVYMLGMFVNEYREATT